MGTHLCYICIPSLVRSEVLIIMGNKIEKRPARYIAQGAIIAAVYAVMTIMQNLLVPGSASMAVQFRISEVITIFALFTPAAVPGLTSGCIIANISSVPALGPFDMIFGSLASLCAALAMRALRKIRLFKLPVLSALMPAVMNGIIVGFEIDFFFVNSFYFDFTDFLIQGGLVAAGELAVLFVLGLPLYYVIERNISKRGIKL